MARFKTQAADAPTATASADRFVVSDNPPIVAAEVETTMDRAAVVAAIKSAESQCAFVRKDGSRATPDGLAQYCCIQGWPLDAAQTAFEHFAKHGWFAAGGNLWGENTE